MVVENEDSLTDADLMRSYSELDAGSISEQSEPENKRPRLHSVENLPHMHAEETVQEMGSSKVSWHRLV